jgi:hypothetical protein
MAVAAPAPTAFDHHLVASLASVRSDGRPHVVPLWFVWDGTAFVMYSKPHAVKVQNLRRDRTPCSPSGSRGSLDGSAALGEVRAEIDQAVGLLTPFADKYVELMASLGIPADALWHRAWVGSVAHRVICCPSLEHLSLMPSRFGGRLPTTRPQCMEPSRYA